jgi:hypothetical protein
MGTSGAPEPSRVYADTDTASRSVRPVTLAKYPVPSVTWRVAPRNGAAPE